MLKEGRKRPFRQMKDLKRLCSHGIRKKWEFCVLLQGVSAKLSFAFMSILHQLLLPTTTTGCSGENLPLSNMCS